MSDFPTPSELLATLATKTATILKTKPEVVELDDPSIDDFGGPDSKRWVKIPDVVAVAFDLRNSSRLGTGQHDSTTARIYEAAVEGAVQCMHDFGANFIDIQGDGGFALFWGELAYERAFCAAVTLRSFSEPLVEQIRAHVSSPDTLPDELGFKVGIAADRLLVKTIGTPRDVNEQEAVWPGRAVNHAVKCAQSVKAHQILVTDPVWDVLGDNDYIVFSCGCSGAISTDPSTLWTSTDIEHIHDEKYNHGYLLESAWCKKHGDQFCAQIMAGETVRDLDQENAEREKARLDDLRKRGNRAWRRKQMRG